MQSRVSRRELLTFQRPSTDAPDRFIHIASALVQLVPHAREAVHAAVSIMPGAELHETVHDTKLAIVLESADERAIGRAFEELSQIPGVLSVSIVAHLTELASAMEQPILEKEGEDESPTVPQA